MASKEPRGSGKGIFKSEDQGNVFHQDVDLFTDCKNRVLINYLLERL